MAANILVVGAIAFVFLILNVVFLGIIYFIRRKMAAVSLWPFNNGNCADVKP